MRTSTWRAAKAVRRPCKAPRTVRRSFATIREASQKDPAELDTVTELPNGLRVATESLPGPFSGVGVYIDAGSRYENEELRGVSHIVDRLAFKSTTEKTADEMLEAVETLGGNIQCHSSREALMYQSATFNSAVPSTIGILADTIRNPVISDAEVQEQLETADYEINEIWAKPELILGELVHMAAYKDNTLGNPLLCPRERLPFINKPLIENYRDVLYKPERMVVAFAGVQHEEAVRLAKQYFGDMKRGEGPDPSQHSPSASITSPDIYALATLQTLLGGGGSFSAGGPGKGMYSRLYTNVLNQHGWIESCQAFNNSFTDTGIFGVAATCVPGRLGHLIDVIARELSALTEATGFHALQAAECQRAKNQLRSALLMNLESRLVELEDLGRQVQVHGRKVGAMEMCRRIEALTVEDLRRVAREVFGGLVQNRGQGSGGVTVVVQEGRVEGQALKEIGWEEVGERIARWKLGRR